MQETVTVTSDTASPEQKKTRNKTPSKQAPVKVLFQAATEPMATETTRETSDTSHTTGTVVIEEERASKQDSTAVDHIVTEREPVEGIEATTIPQLPGTETPSQDKAGSTSQATQNRPPTNNTTNNSVANVNEKLSETANEKETAALTSKKAVTFEVTIIPPAQPTKLSPQEWCALQDEWLHSTM